MRGRCEGDVREMRGNVNIFFLALIIILKQGRQCSKRCFSQACLRRRTAL